MAAARRSPLVVGDGRSLWQQYVLVPAVGNRNLATIWDGTPRRIAFDLHRLERGETMSAGGDRVTVGDQGTILDGGLRDMATLGKLPTPGPSIAALTLWKASDHSAGPIDARLNAASR